LVPWDQPSTWDHGLLEYCRAVIALRHSHPVLRHGSFHALAADGHAAAYGMAADATGAVVVLNAGEEATRLTIPTGELGAAEFQPVRLPGEPFPLLRVVGDDHLEIEVAARSGAVLLNGGLGS
jgi:hypothetical protein